MRIVKSSISETYYIENGEGVFLSSKYNHSLKVNGSSLDELIKFDIEDVEFVYDASTIDPEDEEVCEITSLTNIKGEHPELFI